MLKLCLSISFATLTILIFYFNRPPEKNNAISLHIGKPYEDVLRDSTFPVKSNTAMRQTTPLVEDSTWITSPVIVKFDDPQHGFTLPPTKFGAIGYNNGRVTTLTTSPMLEALSFDELIPLFNHLQGVLKKSGWLPRNTDRNSWLKLDSKLERGALQRLLFDQAETVVLLIPHKYGISLSVKCYVRCNERDPNTAKYLIDVSVGKDYSNR